MATFLPELSPHKKKDGTHAIMIRITVNRQLKRVPIGYSIIERYWNEERKEVRKNHPDCYVINAAIKAEIIELEKQYLKELTLNKVVSATSLQKKVERQFTGGSFLEYAKRRIERLPSPHTRASQLAIVRKLEIYLKGQDLHFEEITTEFLQEYRNYLSKVLGNSPNTVSSNLKKLKAAYNSAILDGVYEYEKVSPFARIKVKTTKSKRTKLSEQQIKQIEDFICKEGTMVHHAKNAFLFAYYMQGIRVGDLIQLTWGNIKGDRLVYRASKTDKERARIILPKARKILDYYHSSINRPGDYIFPFLKGKNKSKIKEDEWRKLIDSINSRLRNNLMKIATKLGIEKLSMHVARHTFADIARKKTGDIYLVSDALDHGDVRTTENYFASAIGEENDEFVKRVFDL